jgi:protein-disulfide isomerase
MSKQSRSDREEVKAKAAAERARQEAVERRRKIAFVAVGVVAILAIGAAVGIAINQESENSASSTGATPAIVTAAGDGDAGGIPLGPDDGSKAAAEAAGIPTVDVYEDFQCPACKTFEAQSGPTLEQLAAEGKARVVYHPLNLIGSQLSGDIPKSSSLRAASAFACATTTDKFMDWHDIAFANQPQEGVGITDDQLVQWGTQAGITDDAFKQCVADQTYVGWAKRVDSASGDRNITGTPTLLVNGKELTRQPNQYTPEGITAAVAAATKK